MKMFLRSSLAVLVLALATPVASFAAGRCPEGYNEVDLGGGNFSCIFAGSSSAPEISVTQSGAGLVLLAGVALMIRGRKRLQPSA